MPNINSEYLRANNTDYEQQTFGVSIIASQRITELTRVICYNQTIYDDQTLEPDEWLGLTLDVIENTVSTVVRPLLDHAAIRIRDNDSKWYG